MVGSCPGRSFCWVEIRELENQRWRLQWVAAQTDQIRVLYVTGEESLQQLALRGERLGVDGLPISTMAENHLESILDQIPDYEFLVIDSIQSLYSENVSSSPGTVTQVRESAERLTRCAKENGCSVLIIGHVTKEGTLAGPKILEHIVDTVLYFEGDDAQPIPFGAFFQESIWEC